MSVGARPAFGSTRLKLALLVILPLVVAGGIRLGGHPGVTRLDDPRELDRRAERIETRFDLLLGEAAGIAESVLEGGPAAAAAAAGTSALGARLEGLGILDADGGFVEWAGMPAEPPARNGDASVPRWSVRTDGARTRLLVRGGPDGGERTALATFIVDTTLDDLRFDDLLPRGVRHGLQVDVTFLEGELDPAHTDPLSEGDDLGPRIVPLRSPDGDVLAVASIVAIPAERRLTRLREQALAWAAVALLVLLASGFDWRTIAGRLPGLVAVAAVLAGARALAIWQELPARLLPRAIGGPGLYGSSAAWDALASPADLVLTALAGYLLCRAAITYCSRLAATRPLFAAAVAGLLAAAATAGGVGLTLSLARNSRIPLLGRPAPFEWDGRLALWVGLVLLLLGAAELWAGALRLGHALPRGAGFAAERIPVGLILVVLLVGASLLLERLHERLALEQLDHEFAPQVLEQSPRRRLALTAALREIQESYRLPDELAASGGRAAQYVAYRYWVGGELFHSRYKSSLDIYTPDGALLSHFGFDLPPFDETLEDRATQEGEPRILEETFPVGLSGRERVLHGEVSIVRGGRTIGVVVGHVLDEPDDLPFLPWSQPYLAALGAGVRPRGSAVLDGGPHYVLYDEYGTVRLTTLRQPPARSAALQRTTDDEATVRVLAGGDPYHGLALLDRDDRLHLLLLPGRTPVERLAAMARASLLGLGLLVLLALPDPRIRAAGLGELFARLPRSFYRKLLAALLVASVVPLVGLALLLRGYILRHAETELTMSAAQFIGAAQQVVEDFTAEARAEGDARDGLDDALLYWLRRVVGQEIHIYGRGVLQATSKRELFSSGLLPVRLDGSVYRRLGEEGRPLLVQSTQIGPSSIPVAYGPARIGDDWTQQLVIAIPLVVEQREIAEATARIGEVILLSTVGLVGVLAIAAAFLARTVARPVRELVGATSRIAAGEYSARLVRRTSDEVGELVEGFNTMASALARQRADIERRRDYIETLLRHATTGVISLDSDGRVVTLNPAAANLLGACAGRLTAGADLQAVLAGVEELAPLVPAVFRPSARGEAVDVDLDREPESRRLRVVRVALRNAAGESFGTMVLLDDVTDLMRSNQLAAWAEMARAIAHEIKNPLTPIQLSTEHLRRILGDRGMLPSTEVEACLETIIKQVRALHDIAGEFSAYSRLPALKPEPTDPVALMRTVIGPYVSAHPDGVRIEERYEPAPTISVDRRVLGRALINLVENALQAMGDGGRLTVGVRPDGDGKVELSVEDDGPGLTPDVRHRLFEPYFSTKSSGTGLGLAIVRRTVEAHHGRIRVDSEPGRGTTFTVELPVAATPST